ncbi:hypothetical protein BU26DRAFT_166719 [Trematosphaeria pertusa]|uniref:Uncharacterized protein n=1 Tax=Trematosphaeria pertusa TaxID=390896 RepID=A0A6A6HVB4_9PLEO|nr:uncharacterized protein BU26DRAFT_166719 [Trematosphaeria pertusa]KAF2242135.1 hypothetical protein BU26DRAFT_166719 [Trematosphaeria pertusa]
MYQCQLEHMTIGFDTPYQRPLCLPFSPADLAIWAASDSSVSWQRERVSTRSDIGQQRAHINCMRGPKTMFRSGCLDWACDLVESRECMARRENRGEGIRGKDKMCEEKVPRNRSPPVHLQPRGFDAGPISSGRLLLSSITFFAPLRYYSLSTLSFDYIFSAPRF